jgi:GDP-4-dehydro-6-deoxy-D-mannose reductase
VEGRFLRALITGAAGFAGSHLVDYLLAQTDWELDAFLWEKESRENLAADARVHVLSGDICREDSIHQAIAQTRPDYVFHLAALASVPDAWSNPAQTIVTNMTGQINLLQAIIREGLNPHILIIGSADEYGLVAPEDLPVRETTPMRPNNPYAVSKIAQDMLGYQYYLSHNLPIVRVRPFNHIGPRQRESFVVAAFAKQIAEAEAGFGPAALSVGNLEAQRDFSDVRDIVRGYYLAVTQGEPGEVYNMASERAHSIQAILDRLLSMSALQFDVELDPARFRPSDMPVLVGDSSKFCARTSWRAEISLPQSLRDTLDYWRQRTSIAKEAGVKQK